jgi:hypothetical protein
MIEILLKGFHILYRSKKVYSAEKSFFRVDDEVRMNIEGFSISCRGKFGGRWESFHGL